MSGGPLTPELEAFLQSGIAVIVGARSPEGRPVAGLGLAGRVDAPGRLRVILSRSRNADLLAGLEAGGGVAATFTRPADHRSIQVKASRAAVASVGPADVAEAARQADGLRLEMILVGYAPDVSRIYGAHDPDDLAAIVFRPEQAFVQTPGPGAGSALGGAGRLGAVAAQALSTPVPEAAPAEGRPLSPPLDLLRGAMEGVLPPILATTDPAGAPNVCFISQVHYVDDLRVALSYQFFNKTRANLLSTRAASVLIHDPVTLAQHRLALDYEETRTSGPLFESMKAKLAGIASHSGMEGVFRLLGADVFRVRAVEPAAGATLPPPPPARNLLSAARRSCMALDGARELGELLDRALERLGSEFGVTHAMALMLDEGEDRLYTVASRGYAASGVGSEVALGEGVIGVAAREGAPIRIGHMTAEYRYGAAVREAARAAGLNWEVSTEIPFPGLAAPGSQIAIPVRRGGRTLGALFCESQEVLRFGYDEEDALSLVADHLGSLIALLQEEEAAAIEAPAAREPQVGRAMVVRRYPADDSLFLDHDYLIKGVAGAILWRLLRERAATGRSEFTTRELRLDRSLKLPEHAENLDARLVLLRKRLDERGGGLRLEKCGRGRLRLVADCAIVLEEMGEAGPAAA